VQVKNKNIHFLYLKHEIRNLIRQRKYLRTFLKNIIESDETHFAVYDRKDIKPFLKDSTDIMRSAIRKSLRALRIAG